MNLYDLLKIPTKPDMHRLLLVDGHSTLYRAFYAISGMTSPDGMPVNAIYGFTRMLIKVVEKFPSAYLGIAFDSGGKTFRHDLYPQYKANRTEMPVELAVQIPVLKELLTKLGIALFELHGVEADDILATIARAAVVAELHVVTLSSDKDLSQLVNDHISLLYPTRSAPDGMKLLDRVGVEEEFGVLPEQIIDFLALQGDTSDNVTGVPGIGPKMAQMLLNRFGSLEKIIEKIDQVGNQRVRTNLKSHYDNLIISRRLMRLCDEIKVGTIPEDCRIRNIDLAGLREIIERLQFRSIANKLALENLLPPPVAGEKSTGVEPKIFYEMITTRADLERIIRHLSTCDTISIDLETTSRNPLEAAIVGIALSSAPYTGYYIPIDHTYPTAPDQLPLAAVLQELRPLIEGERPVLIGQNIKYDLIILQRYGIVPAGISFDAMIASYLLDPDRRSYDLATIAREHLGCTLTSFKELTGGNEDMRRVPVDKAMIYAVTDTEIIFRLQARLLPQLKEAGLLQLFTDVEIPLIDVLAAIERNGITLDSYELYRQGEEIEAELASVEKTLFEIAGEEFNPNSPNQVRMILFERLGLPVITSTKTGPSTSAHVLSKLAYYHPLPSKLIEYRELQKLLNTYIKRLPQAIDAQTGRIHTSFHQTSTATGRLSSSDPNLQNIPTRTKIGERIRRAFIAPTGSLLIGADYSQIELRLLAHLAEDETLIATFIAGNDLHRVTAAEIFAVPEQAVTAQMRDMAKRVNFGIIYGISPYGLATDLNQTPAEAKYYIERFFSAHPKTRDYIERMIKSAEEKGYAETILGRRRPLHYIRSQDRIRRNYDRRNAVNTPIQGSAADLIKLAMVNLHRSITRGNLKAKMLLQIHDELIFEAKENDCQEAMAVIKEEMERVIELRVPLAVKIQCGYNWSEI
ncbi:DNA polymerase I [Candidatus Acetothermia bacterium]|jgi:DNA polymerase-1|nr:DNA polymerase I [Candidatus Acetothermia bacterium]MCI2427436.1 DNA polymerase I [Candidatus Acetothermia bacterium]MCI2428507.1 DNA polymerase I [Candidatus Acetothermia bacterium]